MTCESTAGCHADFQAGSFMQCVAVPHTGPLEGGNCTQLDPQTCSEHDDCVSQFAAGYGWQGCAPEVIVNCTTNAQCPSGEVCDQTPSNCPPNPNSGVCEGVCVPDPACANEACSMGYHCEESCVPCGPTGSNGCNASCTPQCVADATCTSSSCPQGSICYVECANGTCSTACMPQPPGPGECTGPVTCNSARPACPANTTAGIANGCYTGFCIPSADCGIPDPGLCYAQATCTRAAPSCPMGTLPGVTNGCWSGYCIPSASCEDPACWTLTTEAACTARTDCTAVYAGTDCTCTSTACTCTTLTFDRCKSPEL